MVVLQDGAEEVRTETVDGCVDGFGKELAFAVHQSASVAHFVFIVLIACHAGFRRATCFLVGVTDIVVYIIDIVNYAIKYHMSVVPYLLVKLAFYSHYGIIGCERDVVVLWLYDPIA